VLCSVPPLVAVYFPACWRTGRAADRCWQLMAPLFVLLGLYYAAASAALL
jgi:hypothetical protein